MSSRYPGGVVRKNQLVPTTSSASGMWTIGQAAQATKSDIWPYSGIANPISQSLRFKSGGPSYLTRTPAGSANSTSFTFSFWVKRTATGSYHTMYKSGVSNANCFMGFQSGDTFSCQPFNSTGANFSWQSTMLFRDPAAWYHIVVKGFSSSGGNSYGGLELALYVNGVQQTFTATNYNSPSTTNRLTDSTAKYIGADLDNSFYFDGYLTDYHYVDGQSLDSSYFGQTNPITGVWEPKPYSGTYGTYGFHLEFKNTAVGKDTSGNGNNFSSSGISTSTNYTCDLVYDVPTQWGDRTPTATRGNYCTMNPLVNSNITYSDGNLQVGYSTYTNWTKATFGLSSGKWYWECIGTQASGNSWVFGLNLGSTAVSGEPRLGSGSWWYEGYSGGIYNNSGTISGYGATFTRYDVIGVAFDADNGTLTFYKNGVSQGVAVTGLTSGPYFPAIGYESSASWTVVVNFGQQPFTYTPPSGYKSVCTTNLPTPTIGATTATAANKYMDAILWTGDGSQTRSLTGLNFQPDFTWMKSRSVVQEHQLYDAVRGAGAGKMLCSNKAEVEGQDGSGNSDSQYGYLSSFDSNGFSLNDGSVATTGGWVNYSSRTYIAWNWNAGGSTVTNTSGSITSQVRANPTAGFSIVTYTTPASGLYTVGHGLGVAPQLIINKCRGNTGHWLTWHIGLAGGASNINSYMVLDLIDAQATSGSQIWSAPTSTTFGINGSIAVTPSTTYVTYCWAPVAGFSQFGSYTGNVSADGPFIYTGFRPSFLMIKRTDAVSNWIIYDNARNTYNVEGQRLCPNLSNAEATVDAFDFLSNGIKVRTADIDRNQGTIIYAAFAENPFKYALAR